MRCDLLHVLHTVKENLALLLRRVKDSKTNVRKAALQVHGTELYQTASCFSAVALCACSKRWTSDLCCPSTGPGRSSETQCDPYELGEPVDSVRALQRPGCFCEEEGPAVRGRAAGCECCPSALWDSTPDKKHRWGSKESVVSSDHQAKPDSSVVQKAWLYGIVPAVVDSETSVQDKALEALDQVLLCQVKLYSASRHLDASQRLTWDLLGLLCHECQNLRLDKLHFV